MMLGILFCLHLIIFVNCDWSRDQQEVRWNSEASKTIDEILNHQINKNVAKNVILFLGDGMGISTVTAGRIRKGQLINGSNSFNSHKAL
jgi:alkaline phosphatase